MNNFANIKNSGGLLKKNYAGKGPVAQMNDSLPMLKILRMKRDAVKKI